MDAKEMEEMEDPSTMSRSSSLVVPGLRPKMAPREATLRALENAKDLHLDLLMQAVKHLDASEVWDMLRLYVERGNVPEEKLFLINRRLRGLSDMPTAVMGLVFQCLEPKAACAKARTCHTFRCCAAKVLREYEQYSTLGRPLFVIVNPSRVLENAPYKWYPNLLRLYGHRVESVLFLISQVPNVYLNNMAISFLRNTTRDHPKRMRILGEPLRRVEYLRFERDRMQMLRDLIRWTKGFPNLRYLEVDECKDYWHSPQSHSWKYDQWGYPHTDINWQKLKDLDLFPKLDVLKFTALEHWGFINLIKHRIKYLHLGKYGIVPDYTQFPRLTHLAFGVVEPTQRSQAHRITEAIQVLVLKNGCYQHMEFGSTRDLHSVYLWDEKAASLAMLEMLRGTLRMAENLRFLYLPKCFWTFLFETCGNDPTATAETTGAFPPFDLSHHVDLTIVTPINVEKLEYCDHFVKSFFPGVRAVLFATKVLNVFEIQARVEGWSEEKFRDFMALEHRVHFHIKKNLAFKSIIYDKFSIVSTKPDVQDDDDDWSQGSYWS